jgi:peptide/nickel transport system permease protein
VAVPKSEGPQIANILGIKGAGIVTGYLDHSARVAPGLQVTDMLREAWANTFLLVGGALLIALIAAIPIGIVGAVRQRSAVDHVLTFFSFAGFSMPLFQIGMILMVVLAVLPYIWHTRNGMTWLPYLSAFGVADPDHYENPINRIYHLVLPALTLAIPQIVLLSRQVRASLAEVLRQDYIRTARAKGLSMKRVVWKHALRNALVPLITTFGLILPGLASGAMIVETFFAYPGVGLLYYKALGGCTPGQVSGLNCPEAGFPIDQPLALAITLILIVIVAFSNLLTDLAYTVADPRVNLTAKQHS